MYIFWCFVHKVGSFYQQFDSGITVSPPFFQYDKKSFLIFADKSAQMNEFLTQIKANADLAAMFENIQKDAMATTSDTVVMDTSWGMAGSLANLLYKKKQ